MKILSAEALSKRARQLAIEINATYIGPNFLSIKKGDISFSFQCTEGYFTASQIGNEIHIFSEKSDLLKILPNQTIID
jgi:hypothetical protein